MSIISIICLIIIGASLLYLWRTGFFDWLLKRGKYERTEEERLQKIAEEAKKGIMEERKGEIQREEQKPKKIVIKPTLGEELPQVSGIPKRPPETGEAEGIEEEGGEVEEVTELEEEELGEQHRASMRLLREKGAAVIVDERLRKLNLPFPTVSSLSSVVRRVRRFIGGE